MRAFIATEITREETADARLSQRVTVLSEQALAVAANLYGVNVNQILSESSEERCAKARQAVCWLLRARELSFPVIGRIVDRDHTTVMYACKRIDADPARRTLLWPLLEKVAV